ncbi:hypothetical protein J7443_09590 [Tropicibacter sp. R15_0]|uniref:hypothetical protein n=1 Tax=Tropicibacter sp. R15_0 TaxID=2821101 RepID=UPI001AD9A265|nr:hypothetical protein [Tropicibacter sp. R15_0]MBO9465479.1 hypothetical protein [Tropicibacter sp. R15_0]
MVTLKKFIFETPLYTEVTLPEDNILRATLYGKRAFTVDGHCPACRKETTFHCGNATMDLANTHSEEFYIMQNFTGYSAVNMSCAREKSHKIWLWVFLSKTSAIKVGQSPSLADIANDEASTYRSILQKDDAAELHKAIGLAAHGVGIGSFVYLRRIFERLIYSRFEAFKEEEGWQEDDFKHLKMDEKVCFLQGHIPDFLFENRRLYSILSKGIHELSEDRCLQAFEPIKLSIKIILEEDKKKKEELELRKKAAAVISSFDL